MRDSGACTGQNMKKVHLVVTPLMPTSRCTSCPLVSISVLMKVPCLFRVGWSAEFRVVFLEGIKSGLWVHTLVLQWRVRWRGRGRRQGGDFVSESCDDREMRTRDLLRGDSSIDHHVVQGSSVKELVALTSLSEASLILMFLILI